MTRLLRTIVAACTAMVLLTGAASTKKATPSHRARIAPPAVGQPAPNFRLVDQDGKRVELSALGGQKVVLVFYRGFW